jgi:protein-glucosylgalactosylhydroxylysine glucosidase
MVVLQDFEGRVMYDQELWMYPPLLLFHTEIAIVTSRQQQTGSARQNAKLLGQDQGVLYPWQSGATGAFIFRV